MVLELLKKRPPTIEKMDGPDIADEDLSACYDFVEKAEVLSGGYKIVLDVLKKASRRWTKNRAITILDMYCGRGLLSQKIQDWALKNKWDVTLFAVDRYGRIVDMAKEKVRQKKTIFFDVKDWNHRDFLKAQQFDYVVSLNTLHHLEQKDLVSTLKAIDRLSKRGFVIVDWLRGIPSYAWIKALSQFEKDENIRHDARLAIRRGFSTSELKVLINEAGLPQGRLKKHMGIKFSLVSERCYEMDPAYVPKAGWVGT